MLWNPETAITPELLRGVIAVEAGAILAAAVFLFGHAVWIKRKERREARLLKKARALLTAILERDQLWQAEKRFLRDLDAGLQIRMFGTFSRLVDGVRSKELGALESTLGLSQRASVLCGSWLWWRRLRGARLHTLLGGGESAVPPLLNDRRLEVRAQAMEWAADYPSPDIIRLLFETLRDPHGHCRFFAQDSLRRMGAAVVEPLVVELLAPSDRPPVGALKIAAGLGDARFLQPALQLCRDPAPEVRALAATVVGMLGGSDGANELTALLADTDPGVRASAIKGLGQLGRWQAVVRIAALLRDPQWSVRRQAGITLRTLGSPGNLLLQRALLDVDVLAAGMARHILDLPARARS